MSAPAAPLAATSQSSPGAYAAPLPVASASAASQIADALTEGALAKAPAAVPAEISDPAPVAAPGESPSLDALRQAVIAALANQGHASASQLLAGASWLLDVTSLRIEVAGLGKKMLSLTVNAAAEKIVKQELQRLGGPARFMVVPGEGAPGPARVDAPPVAGSIQEEALNNPLVQRAKEIFNAEVRSVVDLRTR